MVCSYEATQEVTCLCLSILIQAFVYLIDGIKSLDDGEKMPELLFSA